MSENIEETVIIDSVSLSLVDEFLDDNAIEALE